MRTGLAHALRRAAGHDEERRVLEQQTRPHQLERSAREYLGDTRLVIASNREPYQHVHTPRGIEAVRSPGGLATALSSVARATGAVWVASATGDADRETVDAKGRVRLPPSDPTYTLHRLWIEPAARAAEYHQFANGCLWPLCHIAYVRPRFVASEWEAYEAVNASFADAILDAIGSEPALVLLQDYHLARCAAQLRRRRPDLKIVLFWHIPWPNHEVFQILPWKHAILEGLLGCDLLGFHINHHRMNFLDSVARELEANVDRERFAVRRRGHRTFVRAYPISPDSEEISVASNDPAVRARAIALRQELNLGTARVILGVDRLDYTKGVPERLQAYERFLELQPDERGRVTFVQIGVPTRIDIAEYKAVLDQVEEHTRRINKRFGTKRFPAVHLITRNLGFDELIPYYLLGDVLAVTSLHDGMNLVAKEYVAAKIDLDGVLILSPYTGASRELDRAIQASPYDTEGLAHAFARALHLSEGERRDRMKALREAVVAQNIYDWARTLLRDARRLHLVSRSVRTGK